ncbi:MFS transporter [Amycolatopsis sp. FDAARGOS 1241]|uniref:MFS transporter n=1 Tax=Amycolatopsis sp. FDAARGOS 1241 TaxID=2778070 RepID=UPI0019501744|nr:MFS transporter [Amycolatopsis sp. FDAARGOS 1241]QRP42644.1 MFS transporter [Amycolatopsis sp. FDAARGOS 1241]
MAFDAKPAMSQKPRSLGEIIDDMGLTRTHYLALALVVLGGLFEVFEQLILSALGPSLEKSLGIDASTLALLSTVSLIAIVVGGISGGVIADMLGRRSLLAVSLGVYCVGSVLSAMAPNSAVLGLTRIVTGLGVGGEIAVGLTYLSELTPTKVRGVFVSLFNTISAGVGLFLAYAYTLLVIGPLASAVGAGDNAWRWAFGLLGLPAVLIFFFRRYLPETPAYLLSRGKIEKTNEALTRLATGRLRLRSGDIHHYVDSQTVAVSESAQHERSAFQALKSVLTRPLRRRTIALGIAAFLAWGAEFSVVLLMPIMLVNRGYSVQGSVAFTMVQNLGGLIGCAIASYGGFAISRRTVVCLGSVCGAAGVLAFALFAQGDTLILVLGFLFQIFVLLVNTTIWTWAPELFPTRVRGFGTAVVVNTGFVGGALLPLVASSLLQGVGEFWVFAIVAVMYLGLALAALFVPETHRVPLEVLHGSGK